MTQFTLVRHSLYGVAADPRYEDRLEVCELTAEQVYHVRAAGGLLFAALPAAELAAPDRRGHFSNLRINGAEVFVPADPNGGMI
jgi:hypothetical protein